MKIILQEVDIKTSDGEYLNGNLYLPVQSDKVPVIIMRTPYGKHNINTVFDPYIIVKKGFALLVQNVRGRYESTGIFLPFENEKEDGKTTVEWVKEQNWSNGHIYSLGVSYEGFTAMMMGGRGRRSCNFTDYVIRKYTKRLVL
ncbi:MAG: CocE/NonD family hydrolase [Sellimonas intestinalis]|uniref:CocE/NonD family hydrolase n=1 Tax=Sellimonas intestinalis TaxID=1653434 RepID=UPI0039A15079